MGSDDIVDHKDGNGLNNQRNNLRIATRGQNGSNRRPKGGSSGYIGVSMLVIRSGKNTYQYWRASIQKGGVKEYLGLFKNKVDAAKAYDKRAIELHGEFANPNFKEPVKN